MLSNDQDLDLNERAQIFSGGFFIHEENVQNRVCPIDDQADQASIRDDVCRCHVLGGRGPRSPNVTDCLDQALQNRRPSRSSSVCILRRTSFSAHAHDH